MNNPNHKNEELNELNSGLPRDASGSPFSVPEGYFEGLAGSILARIKSESVLSARDEIRDLSPLLAGISRDVPYSVPDQYFETNVQSLPAILKEEESLMLSFVDKEGPYEVPLGYFASFPEQMMEKVKESAKVVPITRRKWMRMAVAAAVTGIIAISGFFYFNQGSGSLRNDSVAVEIEKASTEELNAFIKTTTAVTLADEGTTAQNTTGSLETVLDEVSDSELEAFLDEVPVDESFDLNL